MSLVRYFLRAALRGLRASSVTSAVCIATIAVALVPVGGLWIVTTNMERLLDQFGRDLRVTAFLAPGLPDEEVRELAARAETVEGVAAVELVTREEALERFRTRLGESGLLDALDENPLPASLEIELAPAHRTAEGMRRVVGSLDGLPGLEELIGGAAWIEGYARALSLVRGGALGLGAVLGFATLLIVTNTIRLAVYARRDELDILALVGASRPFMGTPFLIEGAAQGALGGLIGLALLFAAFHATVPTVGDALELFLGWSDPVFLSLARSAVLVAGGAGFGIVGALAAVLGSRAR
ncbi:MAG: permease-like cell division protein FtsX [Myxococcota bacterium]|nr:permease-like cell division protein FtsX [Myxococcota bacterium]